jgi:hypothetical protein
MKLFQYPELKLLWGGPEVKTATSQRRSRGLDLSFDATLPVPGDEFKATEIALL